MTKFRRYKTALIILLVSQAIIAVYTVRHNSIPVVNKVLVPINNLPEDLDGFTILQITDLHGRYFGNGQERILALINAQKYDAIALTGDFVDKYSPGEGAIFTIIDNLEHKKPMYFVEGNTDKWSERSGNNMYRTKLVEGLAGRGVIISVNEASYLQKGKHKVWFLSPAYYENNLSSQSLKSAGNRDVKIALWHFPFTSLDLRSIQRGIDGWYTSRDRNLIVNDFDLLISGHTHGGQARLPLIGAVYAPGFGLFPDDRKIMGLRKEHGRYAYVSTGLGASAAGLLTRSGLFQLPVMTKIAELIEEHLLANRFMNPPEIAVLRLTRASSQ